MIRNSSTASATSIAGTTHTSATPEIPWTTEPGNQTCSEGITMVDWHDIATPAGEIPELMIAAACLMYRKKTEQEMRVFEKVLDKQDKYYFSTSEAHALDRRVSK
jgi:hypothetical protein